MRSLEADAVVMVLVSYVNKDGDKCVFHMRKSRTKGWQATSGSYLKLLANGGSAVFGIPHSWKPNKAIVRACERAMAKAEA